MRRPVAAVAAALSVFLLAFAHHPAAASDPPLPLAVPEAVGLSSERLARIGRTIEADIAADRLPGAVVAVLRHGKLAYYEAFGFRDKEAGIAMTKDTIFAIASMTKPMTSAAVMMLNEEGRLFLSDPVGAHLPPLAGMGVAVQTKGPDGKDLIEIEPARRPVTLQDLLRHTSGIPYGGATRTAVHKLYPVSSGFSGMNLTPAEFVDKLGGLPLVSQPGSRWEYSLSVDVLGAVVERVSGQSLGAFLAERLWQPLGMTDTSFTLPPGKRDRIAKALPIDPDTGRPPIILDVTRTMKMECGGGCAASTAGDYVRFVQMLLNRGTLDGRTVLARKTVEFMTADHLGAISSGVLSPGYGFGLGFAVRRSPGVAALTGSTGDYYWNGGYGTLFWIDPVEDVAVVFMAHTPGPRRLHYRRLLPTLVNQALMR
ncbi:serine hydrolase [Allostella sp. ATCC 35155]|nr:serine hydrolase [Stella sp. ATCC 35155]